MIEEPARTLLGKSNSSHAEDAYTYIPEIAGCINADAHPGSYSGQDAYTGRIIPEPVAPCLKGNQGKNSHAAQEAKTLVDGQMQHVGMAVRRLTPRECERLQGFPDDFTAIIYSGKAAADGPRYRALGNSMAVPVIEWILRRMDLVDELVPYIPQKISRKETP